MELECADDVQFTLHKVLTLTPVGHTHVQGRSVLVKCPVANVQHIDQYFFLINKFISNRHNTKLI